MTNRYNCIPTLKKIVNKAMQGGIYDIEPEVESNFITIISDNLYGTELEPYIEDIEQIIYQLMALADTVNIEIYKERNKCV